MDNKLKDQDIKKVNGGSESKSGFYKCVYCGRRDNEAQMKNEEGGFCVESNHQGHHFVPEEEFDEYWLKH